MRIQRSVNEISRALPRGSALWHSIQSLAQRRRHFASFVLPEKLDYEDLVPRVFGRTSLPMVFEGPMETRRFRDGFGLTDERMTPREALREMHYCIICHPRDKDSCSHGFPEGADAHKPNPLGIELTGCPLTRRSPKRTC